jgi:hypothetical protein
VSRRKLWYEATAWLTQRGRVTRLYEASDAQGALRQARHEFLGAEAIEVRRSGFSTVVACWGDRSSSNTCDQCGAVAGGAA